MIRRTPRRRRRDSVKSESREVQPLNERLNDPDLVLLTNKVVQIHWKQNVLSPILTLDKAVIKNLDSTITIVPNQRLRTTSVEADGSSNRGGKVKRL